MYSSLVFVISLLMAISSGCTACKCVAISDESKICLSDFAISGTLLEMNSIPSTAGEMDYPHGGRIDYRISVKKVHRSKGGLPSVITISTETHTCGFTDLQVNATYYIAGNIPRDGIYEISRCSAVVAQYRPDNIPYRVPDVKVNVNVTCPIETEGGPDGAAMTLTSDLGLLAMMFALWAVILKMF